MERENNFLSDKEVEQFKANLLEEKEKILNKHTETKQDYFLDKNELVDPLDEATINTQTQQDIRFKNRENFYLKKIDKAIRKISDGTYGLCEDCGIEISKVRLKARLTAELCIVCKEEAELTEQSSIYKRSKSLGKTLSELGRR